jgi:hypothetical protein
VQFVHHRHRFEPVSGLADQFESLHAAQHRLRREAKGRLIVYDNNGKCSISHDFILARSVVN